MIHDSSRDIHSGAPSRDQQCHSFVTRDAHDEDNKLMSQSHPSICTRPRGVGLPCRSTLIASKREVSHSYGLLIKYRLRHPAAFRLRHPLPVNRTVETTGNCPQALDTGVVVDPITSFRLKFELVRHLVCRLTSTCHSCQVVLRA